MLTCLLLAGIAVAPGVQAQAYPTKPITLVVPYGPGGGVDIVARAIQPSLSKTLGQPVIVENRAGAGGTIAATYVARSAPDGYTLFVTDVGPSAIYPSIKPDLPYKIGRDLLPVGMVASSSLNLAIHPSLPVNSVAEFITYARAHPGTLNFSSPGNGTIVHMAGELFKLMTQTEMVHIPYKSGAEATTALISGQVQLSFAQIPLSVPLASTGKLKILGVSSEQRSPLIPSVPTISEAGVKGYSVLSWIGILVPAGTPPEIIATIHKALVAAASDAALSKGLEERGFDVLVTTGPEFGALIASDTQKWIGVVKANKVQAD
ncbi:MAG: tripartite tricarboxylate transporter substrate binding protein [Casimicrobiaceae bacterium]